MDREASEPQPIAILLDVRMGKDSLASPLGNAIPAVDDPKFVAEAEVLVGDADVDGDLPFVANLGGIQLEVRLGPGTRGGQ
jgi:hypothetical protein